MLLQQWYNLSDVELEDALADRLSFRRFVGLGLEGPTPDHSTMSRFRETLVERGLGQALLAEFERQLDERGLLLKQGTLLDASVVEAQVRRPPHAAGRGARPALVVWLQDSLRSGPGQRVRATRAADAGQHQ